MWNRKVCVACQAPEFKYKINLGKYTPVKVQSHNSVRVQQNALKHRINYVNYLGICYEHMVLKVMLTVSLCCPISN